METWDKDGSYDLDCLDENGEWSQEKAKKDLERYDTKFLRKHLWIDTTTEDIKQGWKSVEMMDRDELIDLALEFAYNNYLEQAV